MGDVDRSTAPGEGTGTPARRVCPTCTVAEGGRHRAVVWPCTVLGAAVAAVMLSCTTPAPRRTAPSDAGGARQSAPMITAARLPVTPVVLRTARRVAGGNSPIAESARLDEDTAAVTWNESCQARHPCSFGAPALKPCAHVEPRSLSDVLEQAALQRRVDSEPFFGIAPAQRSLTERPQGANAQGGKPKPAASLVGRRVSVRGLLVVGSIMQSLVGCQGGPPHWCCNGASGPVILAEEPMVGQSPRTLALRYPSGRPRPAGV